MRKVLLLGFAAILIFGAVAAWGTSSRSQNDGWKLSNTSIDTTELTKRAQNLPEQYYNAF